MSNAEDPATTLRLKAFDSVSEWSKQITTIASATLVLSATFIKDMLSGHTTSTGYLWTSWVLLLLTIVAGVFVLGTLAAPLNSGNPNNLDVYSGPIAGAAIAQILLFLLGMGAFILFVVSNVSAVPAGNGNSQTPPTPTKLALGIRMGELKDAYFDFGKSAVRRDAEQVLSRDAQVLDGIYRDFPDAKVVIEGHCDERGTANHNFGLGYERAVSARQFLERLGVSPTRLGVATYGKELPICDVHDEQCWQQNRRVHFSTLQ
jgi:outer membrane protein OmpA-like peptidoglycan-associated protein